jgi:hypothetical protein
MTCQVIGIGSHKCCTNLNILIAFFFLKIILLVCTYPLYKAVPVFAYSYADYKPIFDSTKILKQVFGNENGEYRRENAYWSSYCIAKVSSRELALLEEGKCYLR